MPDLRNCPLCGKVFVRLTRNICPDCVEREEQEYETVRKYLKENPGASVPEIAEVTEVEENKILKWMREGRIEVSYSAGSGLTCKRCGAVISAGNYCSKCARALAAQMKSAAGSRPVKEEEPEKEARRGMFVADRLREED